MNMSLTIYQIIPSDDDDDVSDKKWHVAILTDKYGPYMYLMTLLTLDASSIKCPNKVWPHSAASPSSLCVNIKWQQQQQQQWRSHTDAI